MCKLKTKKSVQKRFSIKKNGITMRHAGHRHNLSKKTMSRKRKLKLVSYVSLSKHNNIRSLAPYSIK